VPSNLGRTSLECYIEKIRGMGRGEDLRSAIQPIQQRPASRRFTRIAFYYRFVTGKISEPDQVNIVNNVPDSGGERSSISRFGKKDASERRKLLT
jgi:hypothetical protein